MSKTITNKFCTKQQGNVKLLIGVRENCIGINILKVYYKGVISVSTTRQMLSVFSVLNSKRT